MAGMGCLSVLFCMMPVCCGTVHESVAVLSLNLVSGLHVEQIMKEGYMSLEFCVGL